MEGRKTLSNSSKGKNMNDGIYMDLKDILREHALRYLPAKSLYRSVSVCRDWQLQMLSPFFVHNQSISFKSISGLFFQSPGGCLSFLSLNPNAYGVPDPELKFLPEPVDVKSSSNGLLCCQGQTGDRAYYVCNPVNRQWKKLPKRNVEHGSDVEPILFFEPSLLKFVADYKVVCIFASSDFDDAYEFEMYSSAQDAWKVCGEMYFSEGNLQFKAGICVKDVAYWPTSLGRVLSFNMKKEQALLLYRTSSYGYGYGVNNQKPCLGLMNGKLCLSSMRGLTITLNVLQTIYGITMPMKSKILPWETKQVVLNSEDVKLEESDESRVLLTWDNVIMFQDGRGVFSHDLKTHKATYLCSAAGFKSNCTVLPYVNSLVCLV